MKKRMLLILLLILAVSAAMILSGCSKDSEDSPAPAVEETETAETEEAAGTEEPAEQPEATSEKTLEAYFEKNEDARQALENSNVSMEGMEIKVEGNTLIYSFDLGGQMQMDYNEETAARLTDNLLNSMGGSESVYANLCTTLENETGIEDIRTAIIYTWGDHVLLEQEYDANGLVE